jgi:hypothetical protein
MNICAFFVNNEAVIFCIKKIVKVTKMSGKKCDSYTIVGILNLRTDLKLKPKTVNPY